MDLQTAAKRYEEMRRFWAREIALKLSTGHYRSQIALLRQLAVHGEALPSEGVFSILSPWYTNQHSRDTSGYQMLKSLRKAGLITRGQRQNHTYWYALTELGGLVLMYIPPERDGEKVTKASPERDGEKVTKASPERDGEKVTKARRPRKTPALAAQT